MYPYKYYSSTWMLYVVNLPHIEALYDSLHDRQYTTAECKFCKKSLGHAGFKNWYDYLKMYLARDVLLLSDIICKNTDNSIKNLCSISGIIFQLLIW